MEVTGFITGVIITVAGASVIYIVKNFIDKPLLRLSLLSPNNDIVKLLTNSLEEKQTENVLLKQELQALKEDLNAQKKYSEKLNDKIERQQEIIEDLKKQLEICNGVKDMMVRQSFSRDDTIPLQREKAAKAHDLICKHISLDELKTICFRLDVPFNSLEGGERLPAKALALIQYMIKRNKFSELIEQLYIVNSEVDWPL